MADDRLAAIERELDRLREAFGESLRGRANELSGAWQNLETSKAWPPPDLDRLYRVAHSLAGAAATFGFIEIGGAARHLTDHLHDLLETPVIGAEERHKSATLLQAVLTAIDAATRR